MKPNRDDIIHMAREAGGADITSHGWTSWVGTQSTEFLERFAALVRAAERKQILAVLRQMHDAYALASDPSFIKPKGNT